MWNTFYIAVRVFGAPFAHAHAEERIPVNDLTCVVKFATHVRNGPNGEWVAPVHKGDILAPMEVEGHWLHVQVERHTHGWISSCSVPK
jgi:hypothetical protein